MKVTNYLTIGGELLCGVVFVLVTVFNGGVSGSTYTQVDTPTIQDSLEAVFGGGGGTGHGSTQIGHKLYERAKLLQRYAQRLEGRSRNNERKHYGRKKKTLFNQDLSYLLPAKIRDAAAEEIPVPTIECPSAEDGLKLFACPSQDELGEYKCIDDHALCDNTIHCPQGEDEDPTVCMFHRMTMNYFRILLDAVFGLTRSVI